MLRGRIAAMATAALLAMGLASGANAAVITFDNPTGNPNDPYIEAGYQFLPAGGTNDIKCYVPGCLKELQQGEVTTMTKVGGGAFDLLSFYFALVGNTAGTNSFTASGYNGNTLVNTVTFLTGSTYDGPPVPYVTNETGGSAGALSNSNGDGDGYFAFVSGLFNNVDSVVFGADEDGQARLDEINVVPLPPAALLLLAGLSWLGLMSRRRTASAA